MRKLACGIAACAVSLIGVVVAPSVLASSHREAPAIANDPAADNTDVYAWVSPGDHDKLTIVANWIPLEEPAGGPNFHRFSEHVLYEVHIARGPDSLEDVVTYQFRFSRLAPERVDVGDPDAPVGGGKEFFIQLADGLQTMFAWRIEDGEKELIAAGLPVAPPNIGPFTASLINGEPYDDIYVANNFVHDLDSGERLFAGPRDDGFYVDLGGVFDLASLRPAGVAQDGVSGFNTHSIAIEIPTETLTVDGAHPGTGASDENTLGIWASASRRQTTILKPGGRKVSYGPWVQVSRLGLPLINEAMIGLQDKDRFNGSHPADDLANFAGYILHPILVRDAEAVGIYAALGVDQAIVDSLKFDRFDIVETVNLAGDHAINTIGDVLRVDLGTDSSFPNGRSIPGGGQPHMEQADVVDVLVSVILTGADLPFGLLGDGVDYNDKPFLSEFPYLALPHEGFSEGHGVPTPPDAP